MPRPTAARAANVSAVTTRPAPSGAHRMIGLADGTPTMDATPTTTTPRRANLGASSSADRLSPWAQPSSRYTTAAVTKQASAPATTPAATPTATAAATPSTVLKSALRRRQPRSGRREDRRWWLLGLFRTRRSTTVMPASPSLRAYAGTLGPYARVPEQ